MLEELRLDENGTNQIGIQLIAVGLQRNASLKK